MNIVIPFHLPDSVKVRVLLDWIAFLGGLPEGARLFLMAPLKAQDASLLPAGAQWITDYACIESRWQNNPAPKDASGPNSLWTQTAKHMKREKLGPWLWLEPDSMPARRDWYHALTFEYREAGRPFMGAEVPQYGERPRRMSGVAVYPEDCTPYVGQTAMLAREQAFDDAGAAQFLQHAHLTELFVNEWRGIPFTSQEDFDSRVPAGTAIFHGCGNGSIYPYLKRRVNGVQSALTPEIGSFLNNLKAADSNETAPTAVSPMPVAFAISTLAAECQKGGLNKARVVKALMEASIIPIPDQKLVKAKGKRMKRRLQKRSPAA